MNAKAELHKLLMESYEQGVEDTQQSAIAAIEKAYDAGVSDEREACAKLLEGLFDDPNDPVLAFIVDAIRAKGQS